MATNIERHGTNNFTIAVAEVNGWRNSMEDAHVIVMEDDWGYFGVLDGHGGTECSLWCAARLVEKLKSEGCPKTDAAAKKLVLKVDEEFLATAQKSGSTAAMCTVTCAPGGKYNLHVINAGDSRVLLGSKKGVIIDGGGTDQGLTTDHKPDHPSERDRVYRCGGTVEEAAGGVHRVNGDLAVSRGFGDAEHKKTGGPRQEDRPVTCDPEMGHFVATADDFMLIVCDGAWRWMPLLTLTLHDPSPPHGSTPVSQASPRAITRTPKSSSTPPKSSATPATRASPARL